MEDLKNIVKNATLIDVRTSMELVADGKIDHAIHIPLDTIPYRIEEIQSLQKPIIIFCRRGARAGQAIELLEQNGITELYNGGGYTEMVELLAD